MKLYWLKFGSGDPANFTGLSPTFVIFSAQGISAITAPGITETPSSSGIYQFTYGPTLPIIFKVDGGAALSTGDRYITNALDPIQSVDEKVGSDVSSFGSTAVDPTTLIGWAKRNQEFDEGNAEFIKATGVWSVSSRGSSTLLMTKQLTNNTTEASKD